MLVLETGWGLQLAVPLQSDSTLLVFGGTRIVIKLDASI
jgi:hypothetical protein